MERTTVLPLLILLLLLLLPPITSTATSSLAGNDFIHASCKFTIYPTICEQCLSAYAPTIRRSTRRAAQAALSVSFATAKNTSTYVARLSSSAGKTTAAGASSSRGIVGDCVGTMDDGASRLQSALRQMGRLGKPGTRAYRYHLGNVRTWASAALTDVTTCLDSLEGEDGEGRGVTAAMRARITKVARLTSITLALLNQIDPRD